MNCHRIALVALSLLLLASCAKKTVQREITIGNETLQVMMPTGKDVVHPVHGNELWFAVGALSGEGDVKANGVAQSHVFEDSTTIVTVNLNIHLAPKGQRYVAWLKEPTGAVRVRLDSLQNPFKDVRHVITTEVSKDLRTATEVIVTLERSTGPSETDPIEATGTLKHQSR